MAVSSSACQDAAMAADAVADPLRVVVASANLRDLGGLPTGDGGEVRRGRLFRSGHLHELTVAELATLRGLGLRTVVDLRRPVEVDERPTPTLDGVRRVHVSTSADDNEFAVVAANMTDPAMADRAAGLARAYNRSIVVHHLHRYVPAFEVLVDPAAGPALFHCTAGKDRTGFVAAALLGMLGVDDEHILADHELSDEIRREWVAERLEAIRTRIADERGIDPAEVTDRDLHVARVMLGADRANIAAALAAVVEVYGDWHRFRRDGLGIDDGRFAAWRVTVVADGGP
jgi:protein-tyrosine phosphatase